MLPPRICVARYGDQAVATVHDALLCRYLRWLVGLVDSDTLPLNVSREMLQAHSSLKTIKKKLVRFSSDQFRRLDRGACLNICLYVQVS
jgi:HSP90 family molecular chaperone